MFKKYIGYFQVGPFKLNISTFINKNDYNYQNINYKFSLYL